MDDIWLTLVWYAEAGYCTFKNITRISTHSILAEFGHEQPSIGIFTAHTQFLVTDQHPEKMQTPWIKGRSLSCSHCFFRTRLKILRWVTWPPFLVVGFT